VYSRTTKEWCEYSVEIPRLILKNSFTLDKEDEITSGMMRSITG